MEQRSKIKNIFDKYKSVMNDDLRWKQISNEFAELIGVTSNREQRPLVIYGAGVVTLPSILELLNIYDIHPVAISDTDSNKWGRRIKDIPVNSIDEIKLTYGTDVTIIIAVRGNHNDRIKINDKLKELGYKHIVQCDTWLKYREILKLKDYNLMVDKNDEAIVDSFENIQWLYEKFEDELSKKTLEEIVLARLIPYEYEYRYHENGYFMEHLFSKDAYKYVVDCGAYRGDTLSEFIEVHNLEGILQQYHAFEIDPFNIYKLNETVNRYKLKTKEKIFVHPKGISNMTGEISICADGSTGSYVSDEGNMIVDAVTLDEEMRDIPVSFIKMDIEGAEKSALLGGESIIKKNRPVLVISLYHKCKDLWEIPKLLDSYVDSYEYRLYHEGLFEYILFAIPKEYCLK